MTKTATSTPYNLQAARFGVKVGSHLAALATSLQSVTSILATCRNTAEIAINAWNATPTPHSSEYAVAMQAGLAEAVQAQQAAVKGLEAVRASTAAALATMITALQLSTEPRL